MAKKQDLTKRFWDKVLKSAECWEWTAGKDAKGYGSFQIGKANCKAHRVAWTLTHGEIPSGMCVLHTCDNPGCVNPRHLRLGTQRENIQDMYRKGRRTSFPNKGERAGNAKLTTEKVIRIRELWATGQYFQREIANMFDIHPQYVSDIVRRDRWVHV